MDSPNPPTDVRVFQEAVESTGHAIYWTDTTGRIEYVNPAFKEQTGYTADEAIRGTTPTSSNPAFILNSSTSASGIQSSMAMSGKARSSTSGKTASGTSSNKPSPRSQTMTGDPAIRRR